jgi:hypothetical protein|tara:strand:+ start:1963 stop:2925 length:963 start_codon:yes stop_codon:yes gene_type:complete
MAYIGTSPSNGVRRVLTYTATASQTTFTGTSSEGITLTYSDGNYVDVYQNGVLLGTADYTATSGTSIVLVQGASVNDIIVIIVYDVFSVADTVSQSAGGTFEGNVTMAGTLGVTGIGTFTDDIIIGNGKTIGSASKVDAITIASSGLTQLRSTGIGAGSPVLQVIDDGTTILNVRAEDGNISFPVAGAGIYLGVTSGTAANLLDDFEEGTWTPTITGESGTITSYTVNSGSYTKIGDRVMAQCRFNITNKGTGSNFVLTLPFTSTNPPLGIFNETNSTGKTGFMMNTGDSATNIISRLSGWGGQTLFNGNYTVSIQYKSA